MILVDALAKFVLRSGGFCSCASAACIEHNFLFFCSCLALKNFTLSTLLGNIKINYFSSHDISR